MTLEQIKAAVKAGYRVCHENPGYVVSCDSLGQWHITYTPNGYCIGLTHRDGVTMNGQPDRFFIDRSTPGAEIRAMRAELASAQTLAELDRLYSEWIGYSRVDDDREAGIDTDESDLRDTLTGYIEELRASYSWRVTWGSLQSDYRFDG
jgi:hypothetical protein